MLGPAEVQLLQDKLKVLKEDLLRIVNTAVWIKREKTIDRIEERAVVANDFRLKTLFSVVANG
jgi:hypothetical protein